MDQCIYVKGLTGPLFQSVLNKRIGLLHFILPLNLPDYELDDFVRVISPVGVHDSVFWCHFTV